VYHGHFISPAAQFGQMLHRLCHDLKLRLGRRRHTLFLEGISPKRYDHFRFDFHESLSFTDNILRPSYNKPKL
jgi:hypothetical protein